VALIDAGNDRKGKVILAELARGGLGPDAVEAILLTHGHSDHTGGVLLFAKAKVMALAEDVALTEGRANSRGPMQRLFSAHPTGIKVARVLRDGETVRVGKAVFRAFPVPGHTAGSAAYLVNGVLVLGDSANATKKGKVAGAPWLFSDSRAKNRESLVALDRRLVREGTKVRALVFSHSGALEEGLAPLTAFAER
jgi:glyoxylase-like metal-dependent hydrolase (beta-lactamase superfamily II)